MGFRHDFGLQKRFCFSNRLHPTSKQHTIHFNMKSAQMKCQAWTILNCLCFRLFVWNDASFACEKYVLLLFFFAVVSFLSFFFQEQIQFTTEKHKVFTLSKSRGSG